MTNESSQALTTITVPCRDVTQYGSFIDGLYFLIYEGSGTCTRLPDPPPEFVMDVKHLRAAIRHDLNHGEEVEIKKKIKRAGEIFEKFSGKKTPEECGPEELLAAQVRILQSMLQFLSGIHA